MPKRTDIETILIIGSGPIVIGQACEFDYSGTQACKGLRGEGYRGGLVNSNPAPILEQILAREKPQALPPTLGGQTGLNLAVALADEGVLDRHGVELIGAKLPAIKKAEDRDLFKQAMRKIGLEVPDSGYAHSLEEARSVIERVGDPGSIRPPFTLGGTGGNIPYNRGGFHENVQW